MNYNLSKPFDIKYNVVIDGKGHYIDAQKKTSIFKIYSSTTVTIKNLYFKNGKSDKGGAIWAYKAKVNLNNCTFASNRVTDSGGAIYMYYGTLNIAKSTFKYSFASTNGGAIFISSARLVVKNSKFENNKVQSGKKMGHGGAIATYKGSSYMANTRFATNLCNSSALKSHSKATNYQFAGGAVYYNLGSSHTLTGCLFASNKASNHGGAVYACKPKYMKVYNSTFKYNKVLFEDGGAMTFNGQKLVLNKSTFYKNHAYEDGGVMDSCSINKNKVYVTITGCTFNANTAYKGAGTIWIGVKTVFTIINNKFINNQAGMGGALLTETGTIKINKCLFQGNKARNIPKWTVKAKSGKILKHYGGAIMVKNQNVKVLRCTFKKNSAAEGGAIYHQAGKLTLSANKFSGNVAKKGANVRKK